jgi:hypothetical protein
MSVEARFIRAPGDRVAEPVQRAGEPADGPVFPPGGLGVGVDAVAELEQLVGGGGDPESGLVFGGHWSPGTP